MRATTGWTVSIFQLTESLLIYGSPCHLELNKVKQLCQVKFKYKYLQTLQYTSILICP